MADQMDIDPPEEQQTSNFTMLAPQGQNQNQNQQSKNKPSSSSSKVREIITSTIKAPPFAYIHLSTISLSATGSAIPSSVPAPDPTTTTEEESQLEEQEVIDALQVRSYCTAALQRFLGDTGASIVPDILLIRSRSGKKGCQAAADIHLRVPRQDLGAFTAAITAYPGQRTTLRGSSAKQDEAGWLLLQIQSCGDWLGSLIGKAEEKDIWDRD